MGWGGQRAGCVYGSYGLSLMYTCTPGLARASSVSLMHSQSRLCTLGVACAPLVSLMHPRYRSCIPVTLSLRSVLPLTPSHSATLTEMLRTDQLTGATLMWGKRKGSRDLPALVRAGVGWPAFTVWADLPSFMLICAHLCSSAGADSYVTCYWH
jgi:hypothetical protein